MAGAPAAAAGGRRSGDGEALAAPPPMRSPTQLAGPAQLVNQSVKVNVERFIDDFASMGFTRDQVRGVIRELSDSGQTVDTNVVLDRLMNSRR